MAIRSKGSGALGKGPVAAICRTTREAAGAAARLRGDGVELRRIAIVANDYPSPAAAAGIKDWGALAPAWVTLGCLNAIGAGLESLVRSKAGVRRCRGVLGAGGIVVVIRGEPEKKT
jgi:hypothetical protein